MKLVGLPFVPWLFVPTMVEKTLAARLNNPDSLGMLQLQLT